MDSQSIATTPNELERAELPHAHEHPSFMRHHFEDIGQQREAASFGMWVFLLTEVMFFGGLFCAYLIFRNWYHRCVCRRQQHAGYYPGHHQHSCPDWLQLHHGHGGL